ncbi:MAG: ABC transporter ATP-binding protein/permease, partial [Saezia sp.]
MNSQSVLKRIWHLFLLCVKGSGGKIALLYAAIIIGLNLIEIKIALELIKWNKDFYSALEALNASE